MTSERNSSELAERIVEAMNGHDADRVAALVAEEYRSETPAHPGRNFTGREQVRENWRTVFENTPDVRATVLRSTHEERTLWMELHVTGTQLDGTTLDLRGVMIWEVTNGILQRGRIYMEPVENAEETTWEEFYTVEEPSPTE
ncbi:MAG: nuclear transport factor 2 family protein [Haloferacaceae archaeon]